MTPTELAEARAALVATAQRFARTEIFPNATAWDTAGEFPRSLYKRAAELGFLGLGYPEEYGGTPAPRVLRVAVSRTLARYAAAGGTLSSLMSHGIGLPPVIALATPELKQEVVPDVLAGEKISALAITEPGGGSDVAQLKTHARRDGDDFIVNG